MTGFFLGCIFRKHVETYIVSRLTLASNIYTDFDDDIST